jgi:hypothetical protein
MMEQVLQYLKYLGKVYYEFKQFPLKEFIGEDLIKGRCVDVCFRVDKPRLLTVYCYQESYHNGDHYDTANIPLPISNKVLQYMLKDLHAAAYRKADQELKAEIKLEKEERWKKQVEATLANKLHNLEKENPNEGTQESQP